MLWLSNNRTNRTIVDPLVANERTKKITLAHINEGTKQDFIDYVKNGGGLLICGSAISWEDQVPKKNAVNLPGNRLLFHFNTISFNNIAYNYLLYNMSFLNTILISTLRLQFLIFFINSSRNKIKPEIVSKECVCGNVS